MIHLLAIAALLFFGGVVCGARAAGFKPREGWRFPIVALVVFAALALVGCGSKSSSPASAPPPPPFPSVTISNDPSATVSHAGLYDLTVINSSATISPNQTIRNLTITNSTVTMGNTSSIAGNLTMTGSTLHVPTSWTAPGGSESLTTSSIITDVTTALPQSDG